MLFKSALGTFSGKIGNFVASHNKGGRYFRTLTIPVNPQSTRQTLVREQLSGLAKAWAAELTEPQRLTWTNLADRVTFTNALGDQHKISGIALFIRQNTPLLIAGESRLDVAPGNINVSSLSSVSLEAFESPAGDFTVTFTPALLPTEALVVYGIGNVSPGISNANSLMKYIVTSAGGAVSPYSSAPEYEFIPGQKMFARVHILNKINGSMSPGVVVSAEIQAVP